MNIISEHERLRTFRGPHEAYIQEARRREAYTSVIFTDTVSGGEAFYYLPGNLVRLEARVEGHVPLGGDLRCLQDIETLRLWFVDDDAFHALIPELKYMPRLKTLEIGWVGKKHTSSSVFFLLNSPGNLAELVSVENLTLYMDNEQPFFWSKSLSGRLSELPNLQRLTLTGINFDPMEPWIGGDKLYIPASVRGLRIIDCEIDEVAFADGAELETLVVQPYSGIRRGFERLHTLSKLQRVLVDDYSLVAGDAFSKGAAIAILGLHLPPHWGPARA